MGLLFRSLKRGKAENPNYLKEGGEKNLMEDGSACGLERLESLYLISTPPSCSNNIIRLNNKPI